MMKKNRVLLTAYFAWFFLVQGYSTGAGSTGYSTVVGPFKSKSECVDIAKQASSVTGNSWVRFRSTSCWEGDTKNENGPVHEEGSNKESIKEKSKPTNNK